ncbi:putative thioesterase family protein [Rosellinia necatrix]|uniref:Putative thioesterase family protein n=1 Tax=Rosellinia necatrix TaxID=77044 RepID=A0A1W2TU41_ROSNE|nr:putative thioesterase family protein [Rosellinia necatrix]
MNMLRPSQHQCRRALARPIGRPPLHGGASSSSSSFSSSCCRGGAARARPLSSGPALPQSPLLSLSPRPRYFTTSRVLPADPPPQRPETPAAVAAAAAGGEPAGPHTRRARWRVPAAAALFLLVGAVAGTLAAGAIAPPPLPVRGSEQDAYLQQRIQARGAALPLVRQLSADPSWASWDAYAGISSTTSTPTSSSSSSSSSPASGPRSLSAAQSRITSGPMSGSTGLAFQRVFHNAGTGEVVSVVYFGAALAGWPGVVHGGALATVLDESLGRCAILRFPGRSGVTANLELRYRAPTLVDGFYVLRARPVPDELEPAKNDRKLWVRGTLESADGGRVHVEAKALFVVPKAYKLRPLVEGF